MIMEIYLNKEKAEQEGYDVRVLYHAIDQFFKAEGVPKIGHGKYGGGNDQKTFDAFAQCVGHFPKIEWFLKVVDEWYWRELGNEEKYRVDCLESYYKYFGKSMDTLKNIPNTNKKEQKSKINLDVYVDGSYVKKHKRYGVGVLVVENHKIVIEKAIQIPKPPQETQLHEWYAVLEGLKVLKTMSFHHATLYSDDKTICSLFNGAPIKTKKACANIYNVIQSQLKNKNITIAYVKSHKGNLYNERVDRLAGYASGTRPAIPMPSHTLVYKTDDCCFNHSLDGFCVSQSPLPKKIEINSSNTIPYIESLIQETNLPLDVEWIPWQLFCERIQALMARDKKTMKLRKLKTDKEFLRTYEFAKIGRNECIRRKKVNAWKIEAQKML